jgi:hypothetical protein
LEKQGKKDPSAGQIVFIPDMKKAFEVTGLTEYNDELVKKLWSMQTKTVKIGEHIQPPVKELSI